MNKAKIKTNVLVTGASGMLGFEVARYFAKNGLNVIGLFNNNSKLLDKSTENIQCDIGDSRLVKSLAKKLPKLDLIVHCASMTGVDKCEKDKQGCYRANVIGTRNMIDLAKLNNAKIIYISTSSVFSGEKGNYKEDDIPDPKNYYSFTKAMGEATVLTYGKGIVVRATPIGIHPKGRPQANFIEWMVDAIKNNKQVNFFTDVYINALSARSLAKILFEVSKVMNFGLLHLGSKNSLSKADIGCAIVKKFKDFSGDVNLVSINSMPGNFISRPKEIWLNTDRATSLGLTMPTLEKEINLIMAGID